MIASVFCGGALVCASVWASLARSNPLVSSKSGASKRPRLTRDDVLKQLSLARSHAASALQSCVALASGHEMDMQRKLQSIGQMRMIAAMQGQAAPAVEPPQPLAPEALRRRFMAGVGKKEAVVLGGASPEESATALGYYLHVARDGDVIAAYKSVLECDPFRVEPSVVYAAMQAGYAAEMERVWRASVADTLADGVDATSVTFNATAAQRADEIVAEAGGLAEIRAAAMTGVHKDVARLMDYVIAHVSASNPVWAPRFRSAILRHAAEVKEVRGEQGEPGAAPQPGMMGPPRGMPHGMMGEDDEFGGGALGDEEEDGEHGGIPPALMAALAAQAGRGGM